MFVALLGAISGILPGAAGSPATHGRSNTSAIAVRVRGNELVDSAGRPVRLLGVDATGTEDACVLNSRTVSWGRDNSAEAGHIASWGANAVRVPLNEDCWLGINRAPDDYTAAYYRASVKRWVHNLNAAGLLAILDLHWSAPGRFRATQQWPMPDFGHSIRFWTSVATMFASTPGVLFDLFNEPYVGKSRPTTRDWQCWRDGCTKRFDVCTTTPGIPKCRAVRYRAAGMQQLLLAVRAVGARQPVLVGGLNWAQDPCGIKDNDGNGGRCMWLRYAPTDPLSQLAVSLHTYNWGACTTPSCWRASVLPAARRVPVVTSEFGERNCGSTFDAKFMTWADAHEISYLAWSWQPLSRSARCSDNNLALLSNWDGSPNRTPSAGAAIRRHLLELARHARH
ncbi:MAG TPA: cellulase family glycosylhydrolase [Mycobacteriales bacterium]|nr:cellulase family glycosylhydrolase [Mycobacteriales bacterium]